jgi:glucokinase
MSNKIYKGSFGSAGEFGHMTIKFDGKKCSCGSIGCFEEYACERFFKREAKICSIEIFEKAKRGEKFALKIFQEFGKNLGRGLANLINILDPEIIVLGGGISKAHKFFLKECQKEIKKRVLSPISKKFVKIKIAKFGDFSGAIGAALLNLI